MFIYAKVNLKIGLKLNLSFFTISVSSFFGLFKAINEKRIRKGKLKEKKLFMLFLSNFSIFINF